MFEPTLKGILERIFTLKVSYAQPSDVQEFDTLFVQIAKCRNRIRDGIMHAHVAGQLKLYCASDEVPFGYFSKKIDAADPADTKGLFFHEFEDSSGIYQRKVERTISFVYFFNGQYDPDIGTINQVTISEGDA